MRWIFDYEGGGSWTARSKVKDIDGHRCNWEIRIYDDGEFECELDHPDVFDKPCFLTFSAAKDYCELMEQKIVNEQRQDSVA